MPQNNIDVKQANQQNVLSFIYSHRNTTQRAIRDALGLSRSTIIQCLKDLESRKLILREETLESTGGRPATALSFRPDTKTAIGAELLADRYELSVVNLYGETIRYEQHPVPYQNTEDYYAEVSASVQNLIASVANDPERILGVGIVLQGLISSDGTCVTYGKILNCTGLTIDVFSRHLPYPCQFFHDAEAATADELWQSPQLNNAIYMNIRSNVSGSVTVNRKPLVGTELKSGVFEHMTIVPNGRPCYCGNRGCLDTYCSTSALLKDNETLDSFFSELRSGNSAVRKRWLEYLRHLTIGINNLHMVMDTPVILGGTIAKYLQGSDLKLLHQFVRDNTAFPTDREFINVTSCPDSPISRGAALYYVRRYLTELLGEDTLL